LRPTIYSQFELNGLNEILDRLPNWSAGRGPLYRRLADALRLAIQRGDVPYGTRLPAERLLAERLLISRSTVVAAYDLLRQDDLLERRQGSGTRVRFDATPRRAAQPDGGVSHAPPRNTFSRRMTDGPDETVDLVGAYLLTSGGLPGSVLAGVEREVATLSESGGYAPLGLPSLRRAIASHLSARGLPTTTEQVLVTSGAQQAIHRAASLYVHPGDTVVVENPSYPGALDAFSGAGARLAWISTGRSGADVEALADLAPRVGPRLVYLIPTYHNPVGGVMPEPRRRRLARLVEEHRLVLIDDQSLSALGLTSARAPQPIACFAEHDASILTIDSISKLGWGGLRVGWVRAPDQLIARLGRLKAAADLGSSLPSQVIAAHILDAFEDIRRDRVALLAERFELMSSLLGRMLPDWSWERPQGGLCLWVRLPHGTALEFAQVALRYGVSVVAGPVASADGSFGDYLRLPFGHQPATLEEGVRRLAAAWSAYVPMDEPRLQSVSVVV
jgi:DNA-binding transcriptional MocR family regulator